MNIDTDKFSKCELEFLESVASSIEKHGELTNYHAQILTNLSTESVKKYLTVLAKVWLFDAIGKNKG